MAGGLCTAPYHRYSEAQTQVLGSFRTPPVTSRRETNWLLHWLGAQRQGPGGAAVFGCKAAAGGQLPTCCHKTEKATERCGRARGARHTREGGKTGA